MTILNTGRHQAGGHLMSTTLRSSSGSRQGSREARTLSASTSTERIHGHGKRAGSLERRSRQFSRHNSLGNYTTAAPAEYDAAEAVTHGETLVILGDSMEELGYLNPREEYIRDSPRLRDPHSPGSSPQYEYPLALLGSPYRHPLRRTALMMTPMVAGRAHEGTSIVGQTMGEGDSTPGAPILPSRPRFARRYSTTSPSTLLRAPRLRYVIRFEREMLYS